MTEAEWMMCEVPDRMLAALPPRASERKLRLFTAADLRIHWWHFSRRVRRAVEALEAFADGACDTARLLAAWRCTVLPRPWPDSELATRAGARQHAERCCNYPASAERRRAQADRLRCIFGNPFRPIKLAPSWRTPAAAALSRSIYEERRFADLPILGDALEEVGCSEQAVLDHCRSGGEHVRGCWVVDALLGKE